MKKLVFLSIVLVLVTGLYLLGSRAPARAQDSGPVLTPIEELGKALFYDAGLSVNGAQSFAACRSPVLVIEILRHIEPANSNGGSG